MLLTVGRSYVGNDVTHSTLLDRACASSYENLPKYRSYRVSNTATWLLFLGELWKQQLLLNCLVLLVLRPFYSSSSSCQLLTSYKLTSNHIARRVQNSSTRIPCALWKRRHAREVKPQTRSNTFGRVAKGVRQLGHDEFLVRPGNWYGFLI